jgi:nucleoside-diphosphate-sugar epimerase
MRILLTGSSGFLGKYILDEFKVPIVTLGKHKSSHIVCDLSESIPEIPLMDMVIHNAGLAHRIPKNPEDERKFYQVNLFGTQNLIKGLSANSYPPKTFVFISTVAVYGLDQGEMISEMTIPNPQTPYAKSKYEAELLLQNWAREKRVNLLIFRLPLVAGGQSTPGNLGAMIRAIRKGYYFRIGQGISRKSMVLAQDIAIQLTRIKDQRGTYNLTDGYHPSVAEFDTYLSNHYGKKVRSLPMVLVQWMARLGDLVPAFPLNSYRMAKLNESLTFNDSKARKELGWESRSVIGHLDL